MNLRDALAHPKAVFTVRGEIGRRLDDWEIDAICAGEYAAAQASRIEYRRRTNTARLWCRECGREKAATAKICQVCRDSIARTGRLPERI